MDSSLLVDHKVYLKVPLLSLDLLEMAETNNSTIEQSIFELLAHDNVLISLLTTIGINLVVLLIYLSIFYCLRKSG